MGSPPVCQPTRPDSIGERSFSNTISGPSLSNRKHCPGFRVQKRNRSERFQYRTEGFLLIEVFFSHPSHEIYWQCDDGKE